jgi:hypothetical protein
MFFFEGSKMNKIISTVALSLTLVGSAAQAVVWTDWASGALSHTAGLPTNPGDSAHTDALQCANTNSPQSYCNDTFTISWDVDKGDDGTWRYSYGLTTTRPDLSHWIVQVSDNFTAANVLSGSTAGLTLGMYDGTQPSNPGMPGAITGLKWDVPTAYTGSISTIIISNRIPVWGNIYMKGGNGPYVYNSSWFGAANGTTVLSGTDLFGYIARPDSLDDGGDNPTPVPGVVLLVGVGLAGLALRLRVKL